ncbi:hypothetical protein DSAG12_01190 [Promethearchaeum syntrophicum]|uniref:Uncharacterized protein n=1 Tax=Promethearchaeum syntrophicum TaxID=2594042 RepID=A0A5B9D8N7_9ARCH|nr:hypothetical protein [Candidatus Prometheoarchaeum syntrophicum]QEE15365.1 hypothetical protein DSAG12_01190 [Candidatus Prometheoarchaeum syntrophicum]
MLEQKYGRFIGFGQILFWLIVLPWMIITIPLNLYYMQSDNIPPSWLETIYEVDFFNFEWGIVTISTFWMILIGMALIWIGWHQMHPITHQKLITQKSEKNRLQVVEEFSKEKYLAQIQAEAKEFREKLMKKELESSNEKKK